MEKYKSNINLPSSQVIDQINLTFPKVTSITGTSLKSPKTFSNVKCYLQPIPLFKDYINNSCLCSKISFSVFLFTSFFYFWYPSSRDHHCCHRCHPLPSLHPRQPRHPRTPENIPKSLQITPITSPNYSRLPRSPQNVHKSPQFTQEIPQITPDDPRTSSDHPRS